MEWQLYIYDNNNYKRQNTATTNAKLKQQQTKNYNKLLNINKNKQIKNQNNAK